MSFENKTTQTKQFPSNLPELAARLYTIADADAKNYNARMALPFNLNPLEIGQGQVSLEDPSTLSMTIPCKPEGYADAQLDDYRGKKRKEFPWSPPVILRLSARASEPQPVGTMGFGFWNDPFSFSLGQGGARRFPAAPQSLWFFYGSLPNHLPFASQVPGHGWKAASLRSPKIPSWLLAPAAGIGLSLALLPIIRRWVIPIGLRMIRAHETLLNVRIDQWHEYSIDWRPTGAQLAIDGEVALFVPDPPPAPLGFVAWIDNQYASIHPEQGLRFGTIPTSQSQSLQIRILELNESHAPIMQDRQYSGTP